MVSQKSKLHIHMVSEHTIILRAPTSDITFDLQNFLLDSMSKETFLFYHKTNKNINVK